MNFDRGRRPPPRHPLGGKCCETTIVQAIPLTLWAMWKHRKELKDLW